MKKEFKELENFYILDITDLAGEKINSISISSHDAVLIGYNLITDMYINNTGGLTMRLTLKTNYSI